MNSPPTIFWRRVLRRATLALLLAALLLPAGCVRRRLAVRSNPPGAVVFVDNQQIGTTPCSVDFTYYGTREIRLVKPGFETLTVNQPIPTPWYQIPPVDFVSDNLLPNQILDHRTVAFDLQPQLIVPTEQLLDRANQLRQETLQLAVAPPVALPPGALPPGAVPAGATPPPDFGPPPSFAPTPAPTPLPPTMETSPPPTFSPPAMAPYSGGSGSAVPNTAVPSTGVPSTGPPPYAPSTTPYSTPSLPPSSTFPGAGAPSSAPFTAPSTAPFAAPFAAPSLPPAPPAGTQQGPPIVSPPLR